MAKWTRKSDDAPVLDTDDLQLSKSMRLLDTDLGRRLMGQSPAKSPKDLFCCDGQTAVVRRKAIHDSMTLRCFRCHRDYDREIALDEYDGLCPRCGHKMKPAIAGYSLVCSRCGKPLYGSDTLGH